MSATTNVGTLFVISGSSGAGKTSLARNVLDKTGEKLHLKRVITYTTRKPRCGEENGKAYVFISDEEFKQLDKRSFFLEKTKFNGHVYASPCTLLELLKEGQSLILVADLGGMRNIKKIYPKAIFIWIETDSLETLEKRLTKRATEDEETVKERVKLAKEHNAAVRQEKLYDHILVNISLKKATEELIDIIQRNASIPPPQPDIITKQ